MILPSVFLDNIGIQKASLWESQAKALRSVAVPPGPAVDSHPVNRVDERAKRAEKVKTAAEGAVLSVTRGER